MCNFLLIILLIFFGFLLGTWFLVADDYVGVEASPALDSMSDTMLYLFQTLVGQQEWDVVQEDNLGPTRSKVLELIMVIFTIFMAVVMLNLLIALMATTYDEVKEICHSERAYVIAQETNVCKPRHSDTNPRCP